MWRRRPRTAARKLFLHRRASSGARRERHSGEMSMSFQINKALFNQKYVSSIPAWQRDGRCEAAVLSASHCLLFILCSSFFLCFFFSPCRSPLLPLCSVAPQHQPHHHFLFPCLCLANEKREKGINGDAGCCLSRQQRPWIEINVPSEDERAAMKRRGNTNEFAV